MNLQFRCPKCDYPDRIDLPKRINWRCLVCDHHLTLDGRIVDNHVQHCAACGNEELYKRKDFPHGLGMAILVVACVASFVTYLWYLKWITWAILIGTAIFDGALYLLVGDVVVCYRCNAHHRGITKGSDHNPFDLGIGERYRQERIRQEQLASERKTGTPS